MTDYDDRKRQTSEYLNANGLANPFFILSNELHVYDARKLLLRERMQQMRNLLLSPFDRTLTSTQYVSKTQALQLDVISSIFMFLEDYLTFSNLLRTSLPLLHKRIAYSNTNVIKAEISYLKTLTSENQIRHYLLFPAPKDLEITEEERAFVDSAMQRFSTDMLEKVRRILTFFDNYYRVYIRYKHVLSAMFGMPEIKMDFENNRRLVSSHIYIRDILIDRRTQQEMSTNTYILPTTIQAMSHYEDIIEDVVHVFGAVLSAYLVHLFNCQKPALLGQIGLDGTERDRWNEMVEKVNFVTIDNLLRTFSLQVKLTAEQNRELHTNHIFKSKKDFLMQGKLEIS